MDFALVSDGTYRELLFGPWEDLLAFARSERLLIWRVWNGVWLIAHKFIHREFTATLRQHGETSYTFDDDILARRPPDVDDLW